MGAVGMLASFFVTPWLGNIADREGHGQLPLTETVAVLDHVMRDFRDIAETAGDQAGDIEMAMAATDAVLAHYDETSSLPEGETAQALRQIIRTGAESPAVEEAAKILNPADNYGGRRSFRKLAPVGIILIIVFGALFIRDRMAGGYRPEKL